jgi:hypothetical protein
MDYRELAKSIPRPLRGPFSEKLMDALLEAKDGTKIPPSITKAILYYWQRDRLASVECLTNLLKAVATADPQKAINAMDEFGLEEIKIAFRIVEK